MIKMQKVSYLIYNGHVKFPIVYNRRCIVFVMLYHGLNFLFDFVMQYLNYSFNSLDFIVK